jgi:hypothetical protein
MSEAARFAMDAPPLARKYPDTAFSDADQKDIFEFAISVGDLSPEKEAHWRELFASGDKVYVDTRKVDDALVKDGRVIGLKDVAGLVDKVPDGRHIQTDVGEGHQALAFFPGSGWFVAGGADVVERIRLLDSKRDDD